jgi:predicted TPR repeat methyltransferase
LELILEKYAVSELTNTIRIFDKYADQYQDKYMAYQPYRESYDYLADLVTEGSVILDVACGPANISKFLHDRIAKLQIVGCDLSPKMIRLATINLPNGQFEIRDCLDIKSIEHKFDVIIAGFCFPYLSQQQVKQFIADARARLKTDGLLYLSTMEGNYDDSGYPEHTAGDSIFTYYHSAEFLLAQLKANNFDIIQLERKPFVDNGAIAATDLFMYAKAI